MTELRLLDDGGTSRRVALEPGLVADRPEAPPRDRVAYAAAHVIPVPWAENVPGRPAEVDWEATLAFRHHVWSWGLGVADAMDTAQRNMGLDWQATRELIRRSAREASSVGGRLVAGITTDQLDPGRVSLSEVVTAYLEQLETVREAGAVPVMMASRHLAAAAEGPADYERVYGEVLERAGGPVVLHWLGEAFDAQLAGYFGVGAEAERTVARILEAHAGVVTGIKMSLLDAEAEIRMRRLLPPGVTMFTGDDFHYVELIAGDDRGHSNALLGAFAAFAPTAALALHALDRGEMAEYRRLLQPTEALARHVFAAPTQFYKTGIAFLSWLNGHQSSPAMVGGLQSARSIPHLSGIVERANAAGVLEAPELAAERWHRLLDVHGI